MNNYKTNTIYGTNETTDTKAKKNCNRGTALLRFIVEPPHLGISHQHLQSDLGRKYINKMDIQFRVFVCVRAFLGTIWHHGSEHRASFGFVI